MRRDGGGGNSNMHFKTALEWQHPQEKQNATGAICPKV